MHGRLRAAVGEIGYRGSFIFVEVSSQRFSFSTLQFKS